MKIILSKHATERFSERLKIKEHSKQLGFAKNALIMGKTIPYREEANINTKEAICKRYIKHDFVFIPSGKEFVLLTVY